MDHKMIIHLKCCRCNWNTSTVHHLDCRVQYSIFYIPAGVYWTPWFPYSSPNLHALCLLCDSLPTELTYTAKPYSTTPCTLVRLPDSWPNSTDTTPLTIFLTRFPSFLLCPLLPGWRQISLCRSIIKLARVYVTGWAFSPLGCYFTRARALSTHISRESRSGS